jgi:selenocysteine lyase/cysteine desulfurase
VREEHLDRIHPDRYGHAQIVEELPAFRFRLHSSAKKYEYAALAYGAVFQLDAALDFLTSVCLARIEKHGLGLAQELRERIASLGYETLTPPDNPSAIVSFVHGRDQKALALERESHGDVPGRRNEIRPRSRSSTIGATSRFSASYERWPESPFRIAIVSSGRGRWMMPWSST